MELVWAALPLRCVITFWITTMDAFKRVKRYFTPNPPAAWEKVDNEEPKHADSTEKVKKTEKAEAREQKKNAIAQDLAGKGLL